MLNIETTVTTVTVGSGKSIHWGSEFGTICGAAHRSGAFTAPRITKAGEVTCKRCIKIMVAHVEVAHAEALEDNARRDQLAADTREVLAADIQPASKWVSKGSKVLGQRMQAGVAVEVTRVAAHPFPRVSFRREDGSTGTLPLPMFLEAYGRAVQVLQITVRELQDTDVIVLHPDATPQRVIREENLEITRQRHGVYFHFDQTVDGIKTGRFLRTLRYTDRVWVERAA